MRPSGPVGVVLVLLAITGPVTGLHAAQLPSDTPAAQCSRAIGSTERTARIPNRLLGVIALVETGRRIPGTGVTTPWPWTINVNGTGFFFDSKEQAIAAVQALQAQGVQSIDVGCMQVNLFYHARAFASLDAAFDPQTNVSYAGRFLQGLYAQTGTWPQAAAAYHSQTPELGADYLRRVMALWPEGQRFDPSPTAEMPQLYTPELAIQIAADHAGLQRVLAGMRLPAPTDMRTRRMQLTQASLEQASAAGTSTIRIDSRRRTSTPGDTGLPIPNTSAFAAFQPTAAASVTIRSPQVNRRSNGTYRAAGPSLPADLTGGL